MFDIGGMELLVIAIVAIIVVGPKELPRMLRTLGQFVGKAKTMAREFQTHFTEAADEAGLDEVRKGIASVGRAATSPDLGEPFKPIADAGKDIKREIEKPSAAGAAATTVGAAVAQKSQADAEPAVEAENKPEAGAPSGETPPTPS